MMLQSLLFALILPTARAGSGPWVVSEGEASIYGGLEVQRFGHLATSTGSGTEDVIEVDDGVEKTGAKLIVSYGLRPRIELELGIPWYRVDANTNGPVCTSLGLGACRPSSGLGLVTTRAKGLLLDELSGPPLSLSVGTELRFGQLTSDDRERITNLGEGTTDLGAFLVLGRSGGLADGFWSAYLEGGARYRLPNTGLAGDPAPAPEIFSELDALLGTRRWWSIGPGLGLFWRPGGYDIEDMLSTPALVTSIDRFSGLSVLSLRAGGKLIIRSSERVDLVGAVHHTVHAINNPTDVLVLSVGLSVHPGPESE